MRSLLNLLRTVFYTIPVACGCVILFGLNSLVVSLFDRSGDAVHQVAGWWSRLFLALTGVRVDVSGLENVPAGAGMVFVANHLSTMDIPVLSACLPRSFRFLAKTSLFRVPFIGWHLHRGGHIRIIREKKMAAVKALDRARELVERGTAVLVFAEGSRSRGSLQRFKAGAAHVAIKAGVPLVPVAIIGTDRVMPKGTLHYFPGRVGLRIGRPIDTAGLTRQDNTALTDTLRERVSELLAEAVPTAG